MSRQVYIAGPLFTDGERWYLEKIDEVCEKAGFTTYLPHRDAGLSSSEGTSREYFFEEDVKYLDACEWVVAVLHGTDIDSGTAWEIGYAYAKGKKILAIADDMRIAKDIKNINLMIGNSAEVYFEFAALATAIGGLSGHTCKCT